MPVICGKLFALSLLALSSVVARLAVLEKIASLGKGRCGWRLPFRSQSQSQHPFAIALMLAVAIFSIWQATRLQTGGVAYTACEVHPARLQKWKEHTAQDGRHECRMGVCVKEVARGMLGCPIRQLEGPCLVDHPRSTSDACAVMTEGRCDKINCTKKVRKKRPASSPRMFGAMLALLPREKAEAEAEAEATIVESYSSGSVWVWASPVGGQKRQQRGMRQIRKSESNKRATMTEPFRTPFVCLSLSMKLSILPYSFFILSTLVIECRFRLIFIAHSAQPQYHQ